MDKHLLRNTAQRLNVYEESVINYLELDIQGYFKTEFYVTSLSHNLNEFHTTCKYETSVGLCIVQNTNAYIMRTEEYLRLYQSKASIKTLNDQTKIVLCMDLASQSLGNGFDKEMALSLCGFKKSAYQNNLNTLEKVLGLDKTLTISDVCVQLGCTAIKEDAEGILTKYKTLDSKIKDMDHPQYVAAATYLACKAKKISLDKSKVVSISRLKPSQWKELISVFENLGLGKSTPKQRAKDTGDKNVAEIDNNESLKKDDAPEVEEYEVWKQRILDEAYAALKQEQNKMEH